jgi:hypothetical protein
MTPPLSFPGGWETAGRPAALSNDPATLQLRLDETVVGIDTMLATTQPYPRQRPVRWLDTVLSLTIVALTLTTLAVWF